MPADNSISEYSASQEIAAYFSKQHKVAIQTFFIGLIISCSTLVYESFRIRDLGVEPLRVPVYVFVLPFMVFSFIYLPIKNYNISKRIIIKIFLNPQGRASVIRMDGSELQIQTLSLKDESISFYGKDFKIKTIIADDVRYILPLNKI